MARRKTIGAGRGVAAVLGRMRPPIRARGFREGFREGLKRRGGTGQGGFREVRLAGAPSGVFGEASLPSAASGAARGLCAVLPGGLRIEGLDVVGAAALARLLQ